MAKQYHDINSGWKGQLAQGGAPVSYLSCVH